MKICTPTYWNDGRDLGPLSGEGFRLLGQTCQNVILGESTLHDPLGQLTPHSGAVVVFLVFLVSPEGIGLEVT